MAAPLLLVVVVVNAVLAAQEAPQPATTPLTLPPEKHLKNVRQLTFGGQNAEAYFSIDDKTLIFQHQGEGVSRAIRFTRCRWILRTASRQRRSWSAAASWTHHVQLHFSQRR